MRYFNNYFNNVEMEYQSVKDKNLEQEITEMSENPNLSESEIFILHQKEDHLTY